MHGRSHEGMVLSGVLLLIFPVINECKTSSCTTLLCRLVCRLFICLFLQHAKRCKHLLFWRHGHRLQSGDVLLEDVFPTVVT